ncbi:MAG: hypothetical protein LBG15_07555 [Dysgonamonadaceae bacterium]|jgi:protein-S-isoprenylcysteine O-methyltransferase Ste14|nr:hypothetical protein [Dysgonamonadaceae bacterium]
MNLFQSIHLGFMNGWWFTAIFLSVNFGMILYYPAHFKSRVLKRPEFDNKMQKTTSIIGFILFQIVIWYSVLLPLHFDAVYCYIGICTFLFGLSGYIRAMYDYATTSPDIPVTKGIYKISRNPQLIMSAILWTGVGISAGSYIIIIVCILQLILSYPGFLAQEQTCIKKYGREYINYMNKTRRYI